MCVAPSCGLTIVANGCARTIARAVCTRSIWNACSMCTQAPVPAQRALTHPIRWNLPWVGERSGAGG
jgi:hypothetical protein